MCLKAKRTRAYRPQTNGKAERLIKTLQAEWAYAMPVISSEERKRWLPRDLSIHNGRRCHTANAARGAGLVGINTGNRLGRGPAVSPNPN